VALGVRDAAGSVTWHATSADGRPQGTFAAQTLVSAPDGWQGLASDGALVDHVSIAPDGRVRRAFAISPDPALRTGFRWQLAQDPSGGSVVLFRSVTVAGNHWNALDAFRFDASGAPRWPRRSGVLRSRRGGAYFMAAGVSRRARRSSRSRTPPSSARAGSSLGRTHADAADPEAPRPPWARGSATTWSSRRSRRLARRPVRWDVASPLRAARVALGAAAGLARRARRLELPLHAWQRRIRLARARRRGRTGLHAADRPRRALGPALRPGHPARGCDRLHDRRARPGLGRTVVQQSGKDAHLPLVAATRAGLTAAARQETVLDLSAQRGPTLG
jgi:hypothetical protein